MLVLVSSHFLFFASTLSFQYYIAIPKLLLHVYFVLNICLNDMKYLFSQLKLFLWNNNKVRNYFSYLFFMIESAVGIESKHQDVHKKKKSLLFWLFMYKMRPRLKSAIAYRITSEQKITEEEKREAGSMLLHCDGTWQRKMSSLH